MNIQTVKNTTYPDKVKLLKIINNKALVELTDNVTETFDTGDEVQLDTAIYTYDRLELQVPNRDNVVQFVNDNFDYFWQKALEYEPPVIETDKEKIVRLEKEKAVLEKEVRLLEAEVYALIGVE